MRGGLIWRDQTSPGCHIYIYIHVFVCDLAKGADACYTQKNLGKHTRELTAERERERETRDARLSYIHKFVCVCGSRMGRGSLSEVTSEFMCPLNICGCD